MASTEDVRKMAEGKCPEGQKNIAVAPALDLPTRTKGPEGRFFRMS